MAATRSDQVERRAMALLRQALPASAQLTGRTTRSGPDAVIGLPDGSTALVQFKSWDDRDRPERPERHPGRREALVWLVSRASADQRRRWRDHNENFVDLSGAVRVVLPGVIIDRTDLAPVGRSISDRITTSRNPFADRASLVVRALLERPHSSWSATALAGEAGVSLATVSLVTEALRRMGLIVTSAVGRRTSIVLEDPAAVIAQWARRYDWRRNAAVEFVAPVGSPDRFLRRLPAALGPATGFLDRKRARQGERGKRWALTLQAGASLIAPHADWDIIHAYVDAESIDQLIELGSQAGWSVAPRGNVVLMVPWYRTSVWYRAELFRGLPVVSGTQLLVDLWHYPVRGLEQAEFMLENTKRNGDRARMP